MTARQPMSWPKGDRFELTEDHIKLLRRAYVGWEDCETGAPAIDCKRPYGNSDVPEDVAEILGWEGYPEGGGLATGQYDQAMALHRQTEAALQIVLVTGSFEPGVYEQAKRHDDRSWQRIDMKEDNR